MTRFQFIWWGWRVRSWGLWRPDPESGYAKLYRWALNLGPVEIRRWMP